VPQELKPKAAALAPAALARDSEFRALAAVVAADADVQAEALRSLARHAGSPAGLPWLLSLDLSDAEWEIVSAALPKTIPLPGQFDAQLLRLARVAVGHPGTHQASAVAKLVSASPVTDGRSNAARKILRDGPPTGDLRNAAVKVLARSKNAKDRALLLRDAQRPEIPLGDRLARVDALGVLRSPDEVNSARVILDELRAQPGDVDAGAAGRVAARLDDMWVQEWFYSSWAYPLSRVATRDFGRALRAARVTALVRASMTLEQISAVYASAFGLDWEDDASVARSLVAAGNALPDGAARYLEAEDGTSAVMECGWQVLLADESGRLDLEYASAASPESVIEAAKAHKEHPAIQDHFVRLASQMLVRLSHHNPETGRSQPDDRWTSMILAVTTTLGLPFLRQLSDQFGSVMPPPSILDAVIADGETTLAFIRGGAAADLVAHCSDATVALSLLQSSGALLGRDHAKTLLNRVGMNDADDWATALASVGEAHPALVNELAHALIDGLSNPIQAERPKPAFVESTARVALAHGLADQLDQDSLSRIGTLLRHRSKEVVAIGADWARALNPLAVDLDELVRITVEADDKRSSPHASLTGLRAHLATVLIDTANNLGMPTKDRADALRLANVADPAQAHDAALALAGNDDPDLNLAAAEALTRSQITADDIARLTCVYDTETDAEARELYGQALARVHVAGASDAIERLLQLTDEEVTNSLVTAVAPLDGTDQAERLIHAANEVLQSSGPANLPTAFVTAATSLADELMYHAIVAAADAGDPIGGTDVAKIRVRDEGNPGGLAQRQPVQERLPWAAQVRGLHDIRQGHTTKKGQAKPTPLTEKDRSKARVLLGIVMTGWLRSLYESSQGGA